ncbi:MAG: hypothetical protein H7Z72_11875 [Bacteroidetes bacterium]|nr:hypothetical protein [Fibrella sp.]
MELSGFSLLALKALNKTPEQRGDIVSLLKERVPNVSMEEAGQAGRELNRNGYLASYKEGKRVISAALNKKGIDYPKGSF